jgi:hypothetical protein
MEGEETFEDEDPLRGCFYSWSWWDKLVLDRCGEGSIFGFVPKMRALRVLSCRGNGQGYVSS